MGFSFNNFANSNKSLVNIPSDFNKVVPSIDASPQIQSSFERYDLYSQKIENQYGTAINVEKSGAN